MKLRILVLVLFVFPLAAKAAEITAAWSVPLDYVAPGQRSWGNVPKLERPPGESAFFKPGDELWDLSRGFMGVRVPEDGVLDSQNERLEPGDLRNYRKWPGKWLVWNARSGMLIARGSETDILMAGELMNFANLPVTLRARFELATGSAEKLRTVSLGAQSGKKAEAEGEGLEMEVMLLDPGHHGYGDATLKGAWEVKGESWSLETSFTVHYGERTRIAAHGTGEERWELFATITREFVHGVPVSESRWRETEKGIERWVLKEEGDGLEPPVAGDAPSLGIYRVPPDWLARLGYEVGEQGPASPVDPFHDGVRVPLPRVGAPAVPGWDGWLQGEFLNLRELMKEKGMTFEREEEFAALNPPTRSVFLFGTSSNRDLFESLAYGIRCYLPGDIWISSNPESGGWGLTSRSGESATLNGRRDGKEMGFKIEPVFGENFSVAEVRYEFDNRAEARGGVRVEASSKFFLGSPQVIGSRQVSGREEEKVAITADHLYR